MKRILKRPLVAAGIVAFLGAALLFLAGGLILADLPDVASLRDYRPALTTSVWSRDGVLMAELCEENRYLVDPAGLPDYVVRAFVAAEDSQFYKHEGLDWMGILRAAFANVREGRIAQGGSTITQQVAKSLLLTPEKSFRRKFREAVLALRIEKHLTKNEILYLYLNQIYLGHGAYGVQAAARVYFGVDAAKLTLEQVALLAGLPQAPSRYDPFRNLASATERRSYVLKRLEEEGWVTSAEAERAAKSPILLADGRNPFRRVAPFYSEHVRRELEARYGAEAVLRGGMKVVTAMDSRLQAAAQRALRRGLEAYDHRLGYRGALRQASPTDTAPFLSAPPPSPGDRGEALVLGVTPEYVRVAYGGAERKLYAEDAAWAVPEGRSLSRRFFPGDVIPVAFEKDKTGNMGVVLTQEPRVEGAIVCLDAKTGEVLAEAGGYSFDRSQFDRAVQARRQAGSAIKPFIYAAAMEKGLTPATIVYDSPIVYDAPGLEEKWKPQNYGEKFYGPTTLWEGLVQSRNVVTIKVLQDIGVASAVDLLRRAGFRGKIEPNLSLALGACEVSPLELAASYGVFATGGTRHPPAFLLSVEDNIGNRLQKFVPPAPGDPVIDPRVVCVINNMMQGVVREGTGAAAKGLPVQSAGKTGTTNEARDAWFVGVTPNLIAAVWVGYDDSQSLGMRETGGRIAAPIWKEFMDTAVYGRPLADFAEPEGVEYATVDADTGRLAGPQSRRVFQAAFLAGTAPSPSGGGAARAPGRAAASGFDADDPGSLDMLR